MLAVLAIASLCQVPVDVSLKLRNTAATDIAAAVGKAVPGTAVTPEPVSNSILLSGPLPRFVRAKAMIAAMDVAPAQVFISATVCEGDPLGSKAAGTLKILSEPKLMVSDKQTGAFRVAGRPEGSGVAVQVRVEKLAGGKVRLRINSELTTVQKVELATPGVRDVTTTGISKTDAELELRDGETTRLRIAPKADKETWVELRVDVVRESR